MNSFTLIRGYSLYFAPNSVQTVHQINLALVIVRSLPLFSILIDHGKIERRQNLSGENLINDEVNLELVNAERTLDLSHKGVFSF